MTKMGQLKWILSYLSYMTRFFLLTVDPIALIHTYFSYSQLEMFPESHGYPF